MIFDFNKGFNGEPISEKVTRPLIAISANVIDENTALHAAYSEAIIAAGGLPMVIPHVCDSSILQSIVMQVDGVLFSGGADFDATYFGEDNIEGLTEYNTARDYHEFTLLRIALDCGIPVFGICRGFQLFNIALGGDLYQDLPSQYPAKPLNHSILTDKHLGVHEVQIEKGSLLHEILQTSNISVNSRHHQALKRIAPLLKAVAFAPDGVVEAVEGYPNHKILGVQWHPENMATTGDCSVMKRLFEFFIGESKLYQKARCIHQQSPIVDSHCDTPMLYENVGFDLSKRNSVAKVDIAKMEEGRLDATITVAYIPQPTPPELAHDKAIEILERFRNDIAKHEDRIVVVRNPDELLEAKRKGLRSVMLGVENGLAIGRELLNIDLFKKLGVVYITLCHNGSNDICDSAAGDKPHDGVSAFGREVIQRMNELGITVDVSHSSELTTMQAIELSKQPIIASHSSCKALCNHRRNLTDEAIRAIAEVGGVVQICGYGGFLCSDRPATIHDLVAHIEYAISLVGYDYVGVGSDFDGDGGVIGFDAANEFMCLTVELLRKGHSEENVAKIMGGNILRVLSQNISGLLIK
ncbi:MAG: membrane dipeptidase [Rikenellaceae bacterium]